MSKTIVIHTCHVWVLVWIGISLLCILPINYYNSIANSLDENGCRLGYLVNKIICPNKEGKTDFNGYVLPVYKDTGKLASVDRGMELETWVKYYASLSYIPIILTQVIAVALWNVHYKWINFELKTCWPKAQETQSENSSS